MKTPVLAALALLVASAAAAQSPTPDSTRTPLVPPVVPPGPRPQPEPPPPDSQPPRPEAAAPPTRDSAAAAIRPPGGAAGGVPVDRIVAIVGNQPVLWSNVQEVIYQRRAQGMEIPKDSAAFTALVNEIVNLLVDEEVMLQKAREEKIEVSDQDVAGTVDQQVRTIRGRFRTDAEYRAALKENGFGTAEEYRRSLVEQTKRQAMQQRLMQKMRQEGKLLPASVTEEDVNAAFEKSKAQLPKRPATVTFRQIVVRPRPSAAAKARALARAESLLVEIRGGGSFEQVAKRESMDEGTKETGGDLGWNRRGPMVPEFERMMFSLPPGQVSPVFETTYGYHILRVDRVQPAEVKARHILIRPDIDSADVSRAQAEADTVAGQWRAGANLDSLYARHHDPDEDKGLTDPYPRDSLPPSYKAAFEGKSAGTVTDPFRIESRQQGVPKFVVAQLTGVKEGGDYTVADLREVIRERLTEERSIRRFLDQLRRDVYVSIRLEEVAVRGT